VRSSRVVVAFVLLTGVLGLITGCALLQNSPPVASFMFILSRRDAPCVVDFDASSSHDPDGIIVKYEWSLGDGSSGTGGSISHTYTESGTYTIDLTVTDDKGKTASSSETITVLPPYDVNAGLTVTFVASPRSYLVPPLTIQFDASGSSSDQGSIVSYSWSFGDGSTGSGRIVLHTYSSAGSYTVSLTATDSQGATASITRIIQVSMDGGVEGNIKPSANFTASPTSGTAPLAVDFNASGSSDPDGSIASYNWAFGDGTTGTGVTTSHTYSIPGTYTVSLTVIDGQGATGSTTRIIQVNTSGENASPIASFTASPTSGVAPLAVDFNASGSSDPDGSIASYKWAFGDSTTGTGVITSHIYNSTGTYTARLTVTDNKGATGSATHIIEVAAYSPEPVPITFSGTGDVVTELFSLTEGLATFEMRHTGSANFIVWLYNTDGAAVDLLANVIGTYSGTALVGVRADSWGAVPGTHLLEVAADGAWEITVQQPMYTSGVTLPWNYEGTGDVVTGPFELPTGTIEFALNHNGSANFIVWLYSADGTIVDLLVNVIGTYDGSKIVGVQPDSWGASPGVHVLSVRADGDWSVAVWKR